MKIRIILLLCVFVAFYLSLFCQSPDWQLATQAGGNSNDFGRAIVVDDNGNSYVTGSFESSVVFGSYSLTSNGGQDIFVAKMDAEGNWLWATKAGGNSNDFGRAIVVDNNGNSYVTGYFDSTATFGSYSLTSNGGRDIFVAKMDAEGNCLWVTQAGGSHSEGGFGIAIDENGNSYVTGNFQTTLSFASYSLTSCGEYDIFVAKMDAEGNWLWATQAGGSDSEGGVGIVIDENGYCYLTGYFEGTANFGSYSLTSNGVPDIFVANIDEAGNWLWATQAGGSDWDFGVGIVIDENGNKYITGHFEGTAIFGSSSLISSGESDIFVAKMDSNGYWLWATQAGGNDVDFGNGIAIDENGDSYLTGYFEETAIFGSYSIASCGESDIFVAKMDSNGNWMWATQAGGIGSDKGYGIELDGDGNGYIIGVFEWTATFGSYPLTSIGNDDIFVAKLGNDTSASKQVISTNSTISNHPNPFNPSTTIEFSIKDNSKINLKIFNIKGQLMKSLTNKNYSKGTHTVIWYSDEEDGKDVSSGVYYYQLIVNGKIEAVNKCVLLK